MTKLADGSWLAVHTIFPPDAPSQLEIARSTDRARTWTVLSTVVDPGRKVDNGFLIQLPNGEVLLTGRSLIDGSSYRLPVWRSSDNGLSWQDPGTRPRYVSVIDSSGGTGTPTWKGLWEPFFFLLPGGGVSVMYADETVTGHSQVIAQRISVDGGVSWGAETLVAAEPGAARPGMPGVARMIDGRYIVSFEVCLTRGCDVYTKTSADGISWGPGLGTAVPRQNCGPFVTSLTDGRLVITSCSNEVSYSNDLGATWSRNEPPAWPVGQSFTWPAIYQTGPGEIGVVAGVTGGHRIRFGTVEPMRDAPVRKRADLAEN
ncbi:MAG: sialidase family protein [Acidimicrobiales bacterium]